MVVTCNYRMTVDIVRRDLAGTDAWLLVLETYGINVWCAAGKGTFGTDELVRRIFATHLADHVEHETLVLPQLGAVGVSASAVRAATGYRVVWGPVRSSDLRAFLAAGLKATPEMRAVTFTMPERLVLVADGARAVAQVRAVGGPAARGARRARRIDRAAQLRVAGRAHGAVPGSAHVRFSACSPAPSRCPRCCRGCPGRAFTVKGAVAGAGLALLALLALPGMLGMLSPWLWTSVVLAVAAAASYVGVNFTGSTPYTSPSGVEFELRRAIPFEAAALGIALVCWTVAWATRIGG